VLDEKDRRALVQVVVMRRNPCFNDRARSTSLRLMVLLVQQVKDGEVAWWSSASVQGSSSLSGPSTT